ncbi:cytochrome c oxidase assembly factor 6 homolog [Lissotriton helveticus]
MTAPTAEERKACWGARDKYWQCLDETRNDYSKCKTLQNNFESICPLQWVKYFEKRRDYLKYKEQLEAGEFQPSETTKTS